VEQTPAINNCSKINCNFRNTIIDFREKNIAIIYCKFAITLQLLAM
jgi:hypothetical protein